MKGNPAFNMIRHRYRLDWNVRPDMQVEKSWAGRKFMGFEFEFEFEFESEAYNRMLTIEFRDRGDQVDAGWFGQLEPRLFQAHEVVAPWPRPEPGWEPIAFRRLFVQTPEDVLELEPQDLAMVWKHRNRLCGTPEAAAEVYAFLRLLDGRDARYAGYGPYLWLAEVQEAGMLLATIEDVEDCIDEPETGLGDWLPDSLSTPKVLGLQLQEWLKLNTLARVPTSLNMLLDDDLAAHITSRRLESGVPPAPVGAEAVSPTAARDATDVTSELVNSSMVPRRGPFWVPLQMLAASIRESNPNVPPMPSAAFWSARSESSVLPEPSATDSGEEPTLTVSELLLQEDDIEHMSQSALHQAWRRRKVAFADLRAAAAALARLRHQNRSDEVLKSLETYLDHPLIQQLADDLPERVQADLEDDSEGAPADEVQSMREDTRTYAIRRSAVREGQLNFRQRLIDVYGARCCVTGSDQLEVLQAAHILPYKGTQTNEVDNGLLLRVDIHQLFDAHLLSIHPDALTVELSPRVTDSYYSALEGRPIDTKGPLNRAYLRSHHRLFLLKQAG